MSQSGMPALVSSTVSAISSGVSAVAVGEVRRSLRELIAAGPAAGMGTNAGDRWPSLLGRLVSAEQVIAALEAAGYIDQRRRDLPGEVTLAAVLNCCLYSGEGYDAVLARTFAQRPARVPAAPVPTGQAFSSARTRLSEAPLRELFGQAAAMEPKAGAGIPGAYAFGLVVTAIDGTT
ncbi:transposase domain-containing protein, partial [Sphaerisporangium sp. NPDC051017]|uniref:transposase domain-containing protein n=1 Tax=Sphaerisporangium sp. NPDC051017 TaxID=3154636 RepID=UPI00342D4E2C